MESYLLLTIPAKEVSFKVQLIPGSAFDSYWEIPIFCNFNVISGTCKQKFQESSLLKTAFELFE